MPQIITQPSGLTVLTQAARPIGFVPTMGALHRGHFSLLARARRECATVVASIYVNPLQFSPQEDFGRYPRTLREDVELCEEAGADYVFAPQQLPGGTVVVPPAGMANILCGASRAGHFVGVATVIVQLLNLITPQRIYLGQKDAQQLAVIQKILRDLYLPIGVIPCTTIRELDGLALSSRNRYLSEAERADAVHIYGALKAAKAQFLAGVSEPEQLQTFVHNKLQKFAVEYVALVDPLTLQTVAQISDPTLLAVAVRLGTTRLIDNLRLTQQQAPIIAIDGPAGSGKSSVAKAVARELKFLHLDTGAMYRAITWAALNRKLSLTPDRLTLLAQSIQLQLQPQDSDQHPTRLWVDGEEVTQHLRSQLISSQVSTVAAVPGVRQVLVAKQQELGAKGGVVMEGRDIGTHVFPQAELKVFLTASPQERARRRLRDLEKLGEPLPDLSELTRQIQERDYLDSTRATAPLTQAADALALVTDDLSIEEVVAKICGWARFL